MVLVLLVGAIIWAVFLHHRRHAEDPSERAQLNLETLLEGLADGQALYYKTDDYRVNRIIPGIADPPERLIIENWLRPGMDGQDELSVAIGKDVNGRLLQHSQFVDGRVTTTFPSAGETLEMNITWGSPTEWVQYAWNMPQYLAANDDVKFRGYGTLNARPSLIYETTSKSRIERWAFVEEAPLLWQISMYRIDGQGDARLMQQKTIVEYRLLPLGADIPSLSAFSKEPER